MASAMDICLKQRVVIEFLTAEGCSPIEIHTRMKAVYDESCSGVSTVRRWARRSNEESTDTKRRNLRRNSKCVLPQGR